MRTYEEIYDLFIELIKVNINEVKVTFAEVKMLDRKRLAYEAYFGGGKVGFHCVGRRYNCADIIRELCKKNNIVQITDFKDSNFKFRKG